MEIIDTACREGRQVLSEYESKLVLTAYGIPTTREILVHNIDGLKQAVESIGFPAAIKGCSPNISHKTDKGLIHLDVRSHDEATTAFESLAEVVKSPGGAVLVQEMIKGSRELMVGMTRDPQFGPCVMLGLGGIFSEIIEDVVFRLAPLSGLDAEEMMDAIKGRKILGPVRGMPPVDRDALKRILLAVGRIGLENDRIKEIDINPLIIRGQAPIAVDALIVLGP
ncbi:MAG: acetate--CoA ligase family protein [Pseudomonadota bacterium]